MSLLESTNFKKKFKPPNCSLLLSNFSENGYITKTQQKYTDSGKCSNLNLWVLYYQKNY